MKIKTNRPSEDRLQELDIKTWNKWECSPSNFELTYDHEEVAYIVSGEATITYENSEIEISSGDLVVFPKGLTCSWKVKEGIKKVYRLN